MRMTTLFNFRNLLVLFAMFTVVACHDDPPAVTPTEEELLLTADFKAEVALEWNKMFLEVERYAEGYRPGPAPRALAYIGLAAYEANLAGMPSYRSVAVNYPGLEIPKADEKVEYNWPVVTHYVYRSLMHKFFTNPAEAQAAAMIDMERRMEASMAEKVKADIYARSKAHGEAVALAVWEWSTTDRFGHDAFLDPFGDYDWQARFRTPGDWVPTLPGPGRPMYPNWGKARTFATSEAQKLCRAPIAYSENTRSAFYTQALEVYTANDDRNFPDGQWIGTYWSDDLVGLTYSPGPRFISILNQMIQTKDSDLETALFAYAKMGMALNDAAVACWYSKYYYNLERPESYIKRIIDEDWEPSLKNPLTGAEGITPSFPAYPSGHSTMGGAGAEVLTSVFGNKFGMLDRSHEGRTEFDGRPRFFNTFYDMAIENAISRIPLGVHFRMDCEVGVQLGYEAGRRINDLNWRQ